MVQIEYERQSAGSPLRCGRPTQTGTVSTMMSTALVAMLAACISSPLSPEEQASNAPGVAVAPATVWLSEGDSRALTAWLTDEAEADAEVAFAWSSSNAGVVEVDADGVIRARGQGTAEISVSAGSHRNDRAVTVTVTSDSQEAEIATIFGVPRLESSWPRLAYTPRYDELFEKHAGDHYERNGGQWEFTYYDRGLAWYAAWWRTGDARYLAWAEDDVEAYRDDYVLANNGRATPKWVFPEGLAIHYVLTGDAKSREAIVKMADHMENAGWLDNTMETKYRDGRIQGRAILVQIMAHLVTGEQAYADRAGRGVEKLVEWYESSGSNGSWDHPTRTDVSYCGGMATFQVAHAILESMIRYHDLINPDPRIVPIVTESLDYSWDYWVPGEGFAYIQPPESFAGGVFECERSGSSKPAKDVSLLIATTFGDAYRLTGAERFRTRGDEVFEYGLSGEIFMNGYKQFNQSFMRSYRYPFYTD